MLFTFFQKIVIPQVDIKDARNGIPEALSNNALKEQVIKRFKLRAEDTSPIFNMSTLMKIVSG
jgi:hypothetical protein